MHINILYCVCLCLASHQQQGHMEMGSQLKVSPDRRVTPGIEPSTHYFQDEWFTYYAIANPYLVPNSVTLIFTAVSATPIWITFHQMFDDYPVLSYDVASGSEITPCNKIDKPLVVYRFTGNVTTSITTLRT